MRTLVLNGVSNPPQVPPAKGRLVPLSLMPFATGFHVPERIRAVEEPLGVCSPVSGRVLPLSEVPDPAFSEGMLGEGLAIDTSDGVLFSPVTGTVTATVKSNHALMVTSDSGIEVLLHVGVDTVKMFGEGFCTFVSKGDRVLAGEPVLGFDHKMLDEFDMEPLIIVTVCNSCDLTDVTQMCGGTTTAGSLMLRCTR